MQCFTQEGPPGPSIPQEMFKIEVLEDRIPRILRQSQLVKCLNLLNLVGLTVTPPTPLHPHQQQLV